MDWISGPREVEAIPLPFPGGIKQFEEGEAWRSASLSVAVPMTDTTLAYATNLRTVNPCLLGKVTRSEPMPH